MKRTLAIMPTSCGPLGSTLLPFTLVMLAGLQHHQGWVDAASVWSPEFFDGPMQNRTVEVGQTAAFSCYVKSGTTMGWRHLDDFVFLNDGRMTNDARYSTEFQTATGNHTLVISGVTAKDDGLVECAVATTIGGNDQWGINPAYLNVLAAPSDIYISGVLEYRMQEKVGLTCTVPDGKPTPRLSWYRRSELLSQGSDYTIIGWSDANGTYSSINFFAKQDDNEADFTCQAESVALAKPMARTVQLTVFYPPTTPKIVRDGMFVGNAVAVRAGEPNFQLTCSSKGNPTPRLTWFRNNVQEESTESAHLTSRYDTSAVLSFSPRVIENNVSLKCQAVNKLQSADTVQTMLHVLYGPSSVTLRTPKEASPGQMEMNCTSGTGNPPAVITWTINKTPYLPKSEHIQPTEYGGFITFSVVLVRPHPEQLVDLFVECQAENKETKEIRRTSTVLPVLSRLPADASSSGLSTSTNKFDVFDAAGNIISPGNSTDTDVVPTGQKPENFTLIVAVSACVGGAVFFALCGCLIYVIIRGKSKKFEEMANSDSSGSSKGHTEVCSQNGMETGTDTTVSDLEKTPVDSYSSPKTAISPSAIRANAARTYLLDDPYHSPYGTYKHWTAPEPGSTDLGHEVDVDFEGEDFYVENLRRTARQAMQPIGHSPSPLRPIPSHLAYEPIHKTSMLSTFHGQAIPTYRAEALVDEMKGHLV